MKKIYLIFFVLTVLLMGCPMDIRYYIRIRNKSTQTIYVCADFVLPDTLLPIQKPYLVEIESNKIGNIQGYNIDDPKFEKFSKEKLTIFILDKNAVDTCSWEYLRENNLVLKRYEGKTEDFSDNGVTINYP